MMDFLKIIGALANPANLILVLKALKEIKEAIDVARRLIKILSNGNGSKELQYELRDVPDTLRTKHKDN